MFFELGDKESAVLQALFDKWLEYGDSFKPSQIADLLDLPDEEVTRVMEELTKFNQVVSHSYLQIDGDNSEEERAYLPSMETLRRVCVSANWLK